MRYVSRGSRKAEDSRRRRSASVAEGVGSSARDRDREEALQKWILRRQIAWALSRASVASAAAGVGDVVEGQRGSEATGAAFAGALPRSGSRIESGDLSSSSLPRTRSAIGRLPEGSVLVRAAALVGGALGEEGDADRRWLTGRVYRAARADRAWLVESRVARRVLGALIDRGGIESVVGSVPGTPGDRGGDWIFLSLDRIGGVPRPDRALVPKSTRQLYRVGRPTDSSLGSESPGEAIRRGLGWIR